MTDATHTEKESADDEAAALDAARDAEAVAE